MSQPSQAANSRPDLKAAGSPIAATAAVALSTPTPGIEPYRVCRRPHYLGGWPVYPGDWFWTAMLLATISMLATSGWFWAHIQDDERAKAVVADLSAEDWRTITTARNGQTVHIVGPSP